MTSGRSRLPLTRRPTGEARRMRASGAIRSEIILLQTLAAASLPWSSTGRPWIRTLSMPAGRISGLRSLLRSPTVAGSNRVSEASAPTRRVGSRRSMKAAGRGHSKQTLRAGIDPKPKLRGAAFRPQPMQTEVRWQRMRLFSVASRKRRLQPRTVTNTFQWLCSVAHLSNIAACPIFQLHLIILHACLGLVGLVVNNSADLCRNLASG